MFIHWDWYALAAGAAVGFLLAMLVPRLFTLAIEADPTLKKGRTRFVLKRRLKNNPRLAAVNREMIFGPLPLTVARMNISIKEADAADDWKAESWQGEEAEVQFRTKVICTITARLFFRRNMQLDLSQAGASLPIGVSPNPVVCRIAEIVAGEVIINGWMHRPVLPNVTLFTDGPREAVSDNPLRTIVEEARQALNIRGFTAAGLKVQIHCPSKVLSGRLTEIEYIDPPIDRKEQNE